MSTISTFSGFTMARLGIMASSKALEVTGNNISNINTPGYTRQKLDQRALYIGGADRYASQFDVRVGAGALTTGVSQLRDPYLDIRYRNEAGNVGFYTGKYSVLQELSIIFDEVGKGEDDNGIIEAQLSELLEQLQNFNTEHAGNQSYDTNVRGAAKSLASWFNTYAQKLETLQTNTANTLREDLGEVNNILKSIRELNESIKKAEISSGALADAQRKEGMIGERGQQALELRDERNKLIDQLAQYLPIDVTYSDEPIGAGMTVEKLTISLAGSSSSVLIDGIYGGELSIQQVQQDVLDEGGNKTGEETVDDPYFRLQVSVLEDRRGTQKEAGVGSADRGYPLKLNDQDLQAGSLQALREMLTKNGEFSSTEEIETIENGGLGDPRAATKRGIPYYQKVLDSLANKIATIFNQANNFSPETAPELYENGVVKPEYEDYVKTGGNLFSISGDSSLDRDGDTIITAKNISIASGWAHGDYGIVQTKSAGDMIWADPNKTGAGDKKVPASTASTNIAHLISVMQSDFEFKPGDTYDGVDPDKGQVTFFTGSFHGMLDYINGILGEETKSTGEILDNYTLAAQDLDLSRDSVSGVDLNDEAINMMQYQKSYSAACRLLTTLDEILDKLINGTGLAGLR